MNDDKLCQLPCGYTLQITYGCFLLHLFQEIEDNYVSMVQRQHRAQVLEDDKKVKTKPKSYPLTVLMCCDNAFHYVDLSLSAVGWRGIVILHTGVC